MKNRAQGAQNPSRFDLAAPNRCQIVARSAQNRFLGDWGVYFEGQNGVEIREIPLKLEEKCDTVCTYKIMMIFHGFWVRKTTLKTMLLAASFANADFVKIIVFPK